MTVMPGDWNYINRSASQAPTVTSHFYYKDIKQEIVHTLPLEEYSVSKKWVIIMDSRQDSNAASTPAGSGLLPCKEFRMGREETTWKHKRIETSLVIVMFMSRVKTYVFSNNLF